MNKNKIAKTIALILMFTMAISLVALPAANAHDPPWTIQTWIYLSAAPNPIGVGQMLAVNMFLDIAPQTANNIYGDRWEGITVTITDPDGITKTMGPFRSDNAGGAWTQFTPDKVGNYTFVANFPGQTLVGANPDPNRGTSNTQWVGDHYQPSTSEKVVITVQQEPVAHAPETPLPTEYWTRPIYATNTGWYNVSGNWFGLNVDLTGGYSEGGSYDHSSTYEGNFNPYTTGPNTAHIVWTKPYMAGGLIGGMYGGDQMDSMFYANAQYETKFCPIIMNGVIYSNVRPGFGRLSAGWVAIDLYTGEELWTRNTTSRLVTGQILDFVAPNQYGGIPYLWSLEPTVAPNRGTTYGLNDAWTGNMVLKIVNGTKDPAHAAGTFSMDEQGNLLGYYINSTDWTINMWNSTKCILDYYSIPNSWSWTPPLGAEIDWSYGIQWSQPFATNITAPNGTQININQATANALEVPVSALFLNSLSIRHVTSDVIVVNNIDDTRWDNPGWNVMEGYDAKTGKLLWGPLNQTFPALCRMQSLGASAEADVFTVHVNEAHSWYGYSLSTGKKLWGPVEVPHNAWSYYDWHGIIAYGNLYSICFGGVVNCLDAKTGAIKWTWSTGSSGYETPYGIWPVVNFEAIADGKLYFVGGHMYSPPLYHGSQRYCLNATSGELIWSTLGFGIANNAKGAIADGYLIVPNAYDNQVYACNKGPSATTVTAGPEISVHGSNVIVKGKVMDISAGTKQNEQASRFPNGVPAIADADMSAWMEYVYMQQPRPTDVTGVEVVVSVLDSNNNYYEVGRATSDSSGFFSCEFAPEVPGRYTIIASFEGSESYWSSSAETAVTVEEAPAATPEPTSPPASAADLYFLPVSAGMIVAILVVLALLVLILRRR